MDYRAEALGRGWWITPHALAPSEGLKQIKRLLPDGELWSCPSWKTSTLSHLFSSLFLCSIQDILQMRPFLMLLFNSICSEVFLPFFFVITKHLIFVLLILNSVARAAVELIRLKIHIIHHNTSAIRMYLIGEPYMQLNINFFLLI